MWIEIGLFFLLIFILFYRFITKDFNFFAGQDIAVSPPSFPFGSEPTSRMMKGKITFMDIGHELVNTFPDAKVIGHFMFKSPRYIINDFDLAKQILVKDFEYFTDRPAFPDADPIASQFLTNLKGAEWKKMRMLMTGIFTSGKLKLMLPYIADAGKNFGAYAEKISQEGKEIDMKDTAYLLTIDSIAAAGFGISVNSFDDPNNKFRLEALALVGAKGHARQNKLWVLFKVLVLQAFPKFAVEVLKFRIMNGDCVKFFADLIRQAYKQRLESKQRKNDLIDLIIDELKKSGNVDDGQKSAKIDPEDEFEANAALGATSGEDNVKFDDEEVVLIANALLFFFAGFDTTSTGFGMVCHKLCMYPDKQDLVHEEILDVVGKEGKVTFDKLSQLKYMDKFIHESLRFNDLFSILERTCTKNYKVPGMDLVIPEGRSLGIYMQKSIESEENFHNAKEFDPENFDPNNNPNKFAYVSFGQGPRNCIGMRYAMMVMKVGLVNLLRNHKIVRGKEMQDILKINKELNHFDGGIPVTVHRREE